MMIHWKQCKVLAHLPNGRYVIEVTIPARKRMAIKDYIGGPVKGWIEVNEPERKVKAITTKTFYFKCFYNLYIKESINWSACRVDTHYLLGPCITR
jgi:hypothetical protein